MKKEVRKFLEGECRYIFCYGSLRPDDDSGMPWTKDAVEGLTAQPAKILGAKLYRDQYAALVFDGQNEKDDRNGVIGWVLTTENPTLFREKLATFDEIEQYEEDGTGFYQRAIVDVRLMDPERTIGSTEPIGSSGSFVSAYVYHRPDCSKEQRIVTGDWLKRE